MIKQRGGKNIKFMCLVSAPEGIKALQEAHPDVDIYTAAVDEKLDVYKRQQKNCESDYGKLSGYGNAGAVD